MTHLNLSLGEPLLAGRWDLSIMKLFSLGDWLSMGGSFHPYVIYMTVKYFRSPTIVLI